MKKAIKKYKVVKIFELVVFLLLEITFLLIIIFDKSMSSSIFFDKSLYTVFAVMYLTLLMAFLCILWDFIMLRQLKLKNHDLETADQDTK